VEFIVFVESAGSPMGIVFSKGSPKERLKPEEPWPALPRATWEPKEPGILSLSLLFRAVWPDVPDLQALGKKIGLTLEDADPWKRVEALGKALLIALEEVRSWPMAARKELSRLLPEGWTLPHPLPPSRPTPPADLDEAFNRLWKKGFSQRKTQREYAAKVAEALERGEIVLLEAGPGTGKTFGYLIPLALSLQKGGRAVVATRTRTLQDQLWKKDLPWLEENLGLRVERALLKGRENYLCLRRLMELEQRLVPEEMLLPLRVLAARNADLDEAAFADPWLIEELRDRPWRCQGQRCRFWGGCPSRRARDAARAAKLVIVNHAVLGVDLATENALLGEYDYLVVDEAHALPQALREALGIELSPKDLPPLLAELHQMDQGEETKILEEVNVRHREFWDAVRSLCPFGRGRLKPEAASFLLKNAGPLCAALEGLILALKKKETEPEILAGLMAYRDELERVLSPESGEWVQWFSRDEDVALGLTPLDLADVLNQKLWPKVKAAVLTSATLSVARSPKFLSTKLGLPEDAPFFSWPSPFSYEQVRIAILAGLPEPDHEDYPQALASLLKRVVEVAPVKILVLFTAKRTLASVRSFLADVPHLAQGFDGERDQLLQRFKAMSPPAILLGLESFWEGVDLPGKELEILVVARLPFPHPAEPVLEAEAERLRAQGLNEFRELSLPLAVLKLRQGLGRLVRTPTDRGVILIADSRLASRPYRPAFLSSLPVAPKIIHSPEELEVVLREVFR
jgi:ATP-dependent DNA helicase DinG